MPRAGTWPRPSQSRQPTVHAIRLTHKRQAAPTFIDEQSRRGAVEARDELLEQSIGTMGGGGSGGGWRWRRWKRSRRCLAAGTPSRRAYNEKLVFSEGEPAINAGLVGGRFESWKTSSRSRACSMRGMAADATARAAARRFAGAESPGIRRGGPSRCDPPPPPPSLIQGQVTHAGVAVEWRARGCWWRARPAAFRSKRVV